MKKIFLPVFLLLLSAAFAQEVEPVLISAGVDSPCNETMPILLNDTCYPCLEDSECSASFECEEEGEESYCQEDGSCVCKSFFEAKVMGNEYFFWLIAFVVLYIFSNFAMKIVKTLLFLGIIYSLVRLALSLVG